MRAPEFWHADGGAARLLAPAGCVYAQAVRLRLRAGGWRAPVPVVCIGNVVAGGAGKTPLAIAAASLLAARGRSPHILSRGYGGLARGPLKVELRTHTAREVGDEPLLLAAAAPTWVARDRAAGARAAVRDGAGALVMDDGFQSPALIKDLSILAIDGGYGFGNGRVIPAGPLREPVDAAVARAHAAVLIGADDHDVAARLAGRLPLLRARYAVLPEARDLAGARVLAFAGIGRPEKFFATLRELGCTVVAAHPFPDHQPYRAETVMRLIEAAADAGAVPVTTEKDTVRLPPEARAMVRTVPVALQFDDPAAFAALFEGLG